MPVILFNKPYGVLPQFTDRGTVSPRPTLSDFIDVAGVYPAGRLDMDSEGLLLLTDDGRLQARIADPRFKMPKTYLVQVEGDIAEPSLAALRSGVRLNDGVTLPAGVERIDAPGAVAARAADPGPQVDPRLLAQADHPRGAQPPGPADDGGGRAPDVAAGAVERGGLDGGGAKRRGNGGRRLANPSFRHSSRHSGDGRNPATTRTQHSMCGATGFRPSPE